MELSILTITIAILVVWYLGSSINAIIGKSGKLAEREFNEFELSQAERIKKSNIERSKRVQALVTEDTLSTADLRKLLDLED